MSRKITKTYIKNMKHRYYKLRVDGLIDIKTYKEKIKNLNELASKIVPSNKRVIKRIDGQYLLSKFN